MTVGAFRVLYRPTFDELEPLRRVATAFDGRLRTYRQWSLLLQAERAR
jgi:hypothetical protein